MGCPCGCVKCFCKSKCVCQWICNCTRCDSLRDDRCEICNQPRFQNSIPQALNISAYCKCFLSDSQVLNFESGVVRSYASESHSDDAFNRMQHGNYQILPTASVSSLQENAQTGDIPGYQDMIASSNMLSISDCQASGDNQGRQMLLPVITVDTQFAARQTERHDGNTVTPEGFSGTYDPREFYDPAVGFFPPLSPNKLSPATSKSSSHEPESTVCYSEHSSKSPPSSEHDSNPNRRLSPRTHQNVPISDRFQSELPQSLADFPHSSTESTYVLASTRTIGVPMIRIPLSVLEFVPPPPPNTIAPPFYRNSSPQIVRPHNVGAASNKTITPSFTDLSPQGLRLQNVSAASNTTASPFYTDSSSQSVPHNVVGAASNRTITPSFTDLSPQGLRLQHVSAASNITASPLHTDSLPRVRPHNVGAASNRTVMPFYAYCLPQNLQPQYAIGAATRPRVVNTLLNNAVRFYANPQLRASRPQPPEVRHYTIQSNVEHWVESLKAFDPADDDDLPKLEDWSPCSSRDSLNLDDSSQYSAEASNLDKGLHSTEDQSKRYSDSSDLNVSTEKTTVHELATASCISSACYDEARGTKRHGHGLSDSTSSSSTGVIHRSPAKRKEISTVITSSEDESEASVQDNGNSKDANKNSNVSSNPPTGEINVLSEDYAADESSDESVKD